MPGLRFASKKSKGDSENSSNDLSPISVENTIIPNLRTANSRHITPSTHIKRLTLLDSAMLLEQVVTSRKGRGMIAAQNIKRGTRIISEEPLLTMDTDDDKLLLNKLLQLSQSQHDQFTNLSGDKHKSSPEVFKVFAAELLKTHQYSGRYLAAAVRDFTRLHSSKTSLSAPSFLPTKF